MRKPRIGVTTWRRTVSTFLGEETDLYTLGIEYASSIQSVGGLPVLLPHGTAEDAEVYLDTFDALLVTGGGDVDPGLYGQAPTGTHMEEVNPAADAFEIALIHAAHKRRMPTLGICRGAQILQVAFGGTLHQHLFVQFPTHPAVDVSIDELLGVRQWVNFAPDSGLARMYGEQRRFVNSIHHQAIDRLGDGFIATAWSDDGVVEGVESTTDWTCIAVQWHPEKIQDGSEMRLFTALVEWARQEAALTVDTRGSRR